MGFGDGVFAGVIAALIAAAIFMGGGVVNDSLVRNDCKALGKFRSGGEVYTCHLEPQK